MTKSEVKEKLIEANFKMDMKIGCNECYYLDGMRIVLNDTWLEMWGKKSYFETEPVKVHRIELRDTGISFILKDVIIEIFY